MQVQIQRNWVKIIWRLWIWSWQQFCFCHQFLFNFTSYLRDNNMQWWEEWGRVWRWRSAWQLGSYSRSRRGSQLEQCRRCLRILREAVCLAKEDQLPWIPGKSLHTRRRLDIPLKTQFLELGSGQLVQRFCCTYPGSMLSWIRKWREVLWCRCRRWKSRERRTSWRNLHRKLSHQDCCSLKGRWIKGQREGRCWWHF